MVKSFPWPKAAISRRAAELRARFAASRVGQRRTACVELSGREALTEDFLSVELSKPAPSGLIPVRIVAAEGARAMAEAASRRAQNPAWV